MGAPTIVLNNGQKFPILGLGTWQSAPGEVEKAVKDAIDVGYRHFDCAMLYGNEVEIGSAIREKIAEGAVQREDLFIVTKLWNTFHEKESVVPTCKKSLENFGLDYLDQYLIHWPVAQKTVGKLDVSFPFANAYGIDYQWRLVIITAAFQCVTLFVWLRGVVHFTFNAYSEIFDQSADLVGHVPLCPYAPAATVDYDYVDTWKGMEECVKLGLAKGIGLSNFNSKQIERILNIATIKPVVNQIEVHPNLNQKKLIQFCKDRDIVITAYSPFGSPTRPWAKPGDPVLSRDDPKLVGIGEKYGKTSAQVILRYLIDIGVVPIPKSANRERIRQNIDIFDFKLTPEEIAVIDTFDCNGRAVPAVELKDMPHYPFGTEVEY